MVFSHMLRQARDGRRLEQGRQRQRCVQPALDGGGELYGGDGIATEFEEIIGDADALQSQYAVPEGGEPPLRSGPGWHRRSIQAGPGRGRHRQCLAVELAAGAERQLGNEHPALGYQVFGHAALEPVAERGHRQRIAHPGHSTEQAPMQCRASRGGFPVSRRMATFEPAIRSRQAHRHRVVGKIRIGTVMALPLELQHAAASYRERFIRERQVDRQPGLLFGEVIHDLAGTGRNHGPQQTAVEVTIPLDQQFRTANQRRRQRSAEIQILEVGRCRQQGRRADIAHAEAQIDVVARPVKQPPGIVGRQRTETGFFPRTGG